MCAHATSATDVIEKLSLKLYPFIDAQFRELTEFNRTKPPCNNASTMFEVVQSLRNEFDSLRNYETKLVFPAVQQVFNTKDSPGFRPSANINELQQLTHKKEALIRELLDDLQSEAEALNLKKGHPVYSIMYSFNQLFFEEKAKWNEMVNGWNRTCACFVKANAASIEQLKNTVHAG